MMEQQVDTLREEAMAFIRERLTAELAAVSGIRSKMSGTADELIAVAYKYKTDPRLFRFSANKDLEKEVDGIISRLVEYIVWETERYAVYGRDDEKEDIVSALYSRSYGGKTFRERVRMYADRYRFEVEAAIAAGLLAGKLQKEVKKSVDSNLSAPYNNPLIKNAYGKGLAAARILTHGKSYGVGRSNSAFNALSLLSRNEVAVSWMTWYAGKASARGATGFYSFRGSSYPCATCQDNAGYLHPISDFYGAYHPRCCCYFVFV